LYLEFNAGRDRYLRRIIFHSGNVSLFEKQLVFEGENFLALIQKGVARPSWSDEVWLMMWFSATMIGDCTWIPGVWTDGSTRERVFLDGGLAVPAFAVGAATDISMSVSPPP
jgi:hypothetical protein